MKKGFTPVLILIFIVALIILGLAVLWQLKPKTSNINQQTNQQSTQSAATDPTANWKTYTNETFTLKYPPTFLKQIDSEYQDGTTVDLSLTSGENMKNNLIISGGRIRILKKVLPQNTLNSAYDYFLHSANVITKVNAGVAGQPSYEGIASSPEGLANEYKYAVVSNGKISLLVQAISSKASQDRIYKSFDEIIQTIKFTEDHISTANWKTFTNSVFGFSLQYPASLVMTRPIYESNDKLPIDSWSAPDSSYIMTVYGFPYSLYDYLNMSSVYKTSSQFRINFAGENAQWLQGTDQSSNIGTRIVVGPVTGPNKEVYYFVYTSGSQKATPTSIEEFKKMVQSFKFTQ